MTSPAATSTSNRPARVATLGLELQSFLAGMKQSIEDEIQDYPKPIPRCDAQFNFLYEQRSRISLLMDRLSAASTRSPSTNELIGVLLDFVKSAPLSESPRERELRERLKADLGV